MKDKLTKKRIKVDYLLVIKCANEEENFLRFLNSHKSKVSFRRKAYAFCKHKSIDIERIFSQCLEQGITSYDEYFAYMCRIAKTPWLDGD